MLGLFERDIRLEEEMFKKKTKEKQTEVNTVKIY
jgi:hypothetical protein